MADNLTAGNPRAHAVRVHFIDTSTKIYEGMPVCYNFDTTTNWWGGSVSDGAVTAATTLADGNQNPAKYMEVELPSANNIQWFAGVVKKGGWCGKTTSSTSGVGQILDIYVPNGAIVPVRTDQNCLIGQTILAITTGQSELGVPLATDSRPVAITEETKDRGTAGLVLAKLDPNLFIYQDHAGTALSVDDADTGTNSIVNSINISSLQTSGWCIAFSVCQSTATVSNSSMIYLGLTNSGTGAGGFHVIQVRGEAEGTAIAGDVNGIYTQVNLAASSATTTAGTTTGIFSKVHVKTGAGTIAGKVVAGRFCLGLDANPTGNTSQLYFEHTGGSYVDYLFEALYAASIGGVSTSYITASHGIPVRIQGATYYLLLDKV